MVSKGLCVGLTVNGCFRPVRKAVGNLELSKAFAATHQHTRSICNRTGIIARAKKSVQRYLRQYANPQGPNSPIYKGDYT